MLVYGDQFLLMADLVLRSNTRKDYYDVIGWTQSNCLFFEDIPQNFNNPTLIFCNTEDCHLLKNTLQHFTKPFVLLSHNSDTNVTETYSYIYEHPLVHHWFTQNAIVSHPKVTFLPIGKANPIWNHGNPDFFSQIQEHAPSKINSFYANFLVQTNPTARELCQSTLAKFHIRNYPKTHPLQFFIHLASSYYSICPEGNGIDTHRFWESLYFKTIPIVLRSPFTEKLQSLYPCFLIDSWDKLLEQMIPYDPLAFTQEMYTTMGFEYYKSLIYIALNSI